MNQFGSDVQILHIELTFVGAQFGDVYTEISHMLALELLPFGLVAVHLWQSRYSMPLQAAV